MKIRIVYNRLLGAWFVVRAPRQWTGLTDEDIHNLPMYQETREMYRLARAIEAKLKEKNK